MDEKCDRCGPGTRAAYRVDKDGKTLTLCGHCAIRHWPWMAAQGWLVTSLTITVPQLTPQVKGRYWVDEVAS